ncbi:MAG: 2-oxo acid dehydrogenase subunit E2 [Verrucomicrobiaceae bacterium]|nr:2-oxo acid dehydrogenase subunit E2 [Verrucomicrobiaceae bacterium]
MADFVMPNLGADMEAGTLVKWHVKSGDAVKRGQVIAEVDTEKGIIDIECFEPGVIEQIRIEPGAKIPVGTVMAVIRGAEEAPAPAKPVAAPEPAAPTKAPHVHASPLAKKIAAELGVDLTKLTGSGPGGLIDREDVERAAPTKKAPPPAETARAKVSPLARRLAAERGIDLANITPGPGGIIEQADVERAAAPAKPETAPASKPGDGMRRAIAAAMAKSNREIPHYYLQTRIDMSAALKWLEAENAKRSIKDRLLPAVLLLKAVAKALGDVPALNGFWIDNEHRVSPAIHLGFAISMKGGGLVAPAIHDVGEMSCDEIMAALRDLIPRARAGRLRSSEMTDATLTVTSLGDLGVESVFGVIYPPQVGLVGFGKIIEQPWAKDGVLGVHPIMTASLAADHRATDGHTGAQFLDVLNQHFQTPETL